MKLYLSYRDIPEMEGIQKSERQKVWRSFLQNHGHLSREAVFGFFVPLCLLLLLGAALIRQLDIATHKQAIIFVPYGIVVTVVCGWSYVTLLRKPFRKYLSSTAP